MSRPPEASLHSQKSFCNTLAMAARPDCLAAWADRKFPEAYSSFREKGGRSKGTSPGQNQQCWGRSVSFKDRQGKAGLSCKSFGGFLKFGMG